MKNVADPPPEHGLFGAGLTAADAEDAATCAARVIAEQALSIFEAAEARASELDVSARSEADDIAGRAAASARTLAELEAIARQLDALSVELAGRIEKRAAMDDGR